jgi:hypothetical protein
MDSKKFDKLAIALASPGSRRKMLRGLSAGALGAVFGLRRAAPTGAAPACRVIGEACRTTTDCCGNSNLICVTVGTTGAQRCECDLQAGFVQCGGQCVSQNCPAGATFTCENGVGSCNCPAGSEVCGNQCRALCGGGTVRNPTTCACECGSGQELCNGSCVNLCPAGEQRNSDCTCGCPTGTVSCGGRCVTACAGGQELNNDCQCVCPNGGELCQSTCRAACPTGEVRNPETCNCACPTGTSACGGTCVTTCTSGLVFNNACECVCPTVGGQAGIFCNGACHYNTECSGNKVFNAVCCSCQNPGQPSGKCK